MYIIGMYAVMEDYNSETVLIDYTKEHKKAIR